MKLQVENNVVIGYALEEMPFQAISDYSSSKCGFKEIGVELEIAEGITTIGKSAFAGCGELRSVVLPKSLKTIESKAFEKCACLESVTMFDGIESIGANAFKGCGKLKSIELPHNLKAIPAGLFKDCKLLEAVIINEQCSTIGGSAFENTNIKTIQLPPSVKIIKAKAFNNAGLKEIFFSEGLESLGDYSLAKNEIKEIILPESIRHIGAFWISNTFRTLERVYLPDGLNDIDLDAFCPAGYDNIKWDIYEVNMGSPVIELVDKIVEMSSHAGSEPKSSWNLKGRLKLKLIKD